MQIQRGFVERLLRVVGFGLLLWSLVLVHGNGF